MIFYVIRHGQTEWNVKGLLQGNTDIELNEKGLAQAHEAAEEFASLKVDLIVSSPLKRAGTTAGIIGRRIGVEVIEKDALRERCFGKYEGKVIKNYAVRGIESLKHLNNYNLNESVDGIEPIRDICARVWGLLDELKADCAGKNIVLVTHGETCRVIDAYFRGYGADGQIDNPIPENCSIVTYEC